MGMPDMRYYTAEMVRALPDDGRRYEVVHGELLVTPSPRLWHQELARRLLVTLDAYLREDRAGLVFYAPADISWSEDSLVQPDVFVVPVDDARTLDWARLRHLLLVAEVLSPSTARADRFAKRRLYEEMGVPTYWIVDGETHQVEVWTLGALRPHVERERLTWQPPGAPRALTIELTELFRPI
jgi:Uma2 family endonuclease